MRTLVLIGSFLISTTALSRKTLTVDAFVQRVLNGPAGEAIEQDVGLARARARGAGLWPNPYLSWNRESLPGSNVAQSTQDIVWLSVRLVLSGRTVAESSAAEHSIESARLYSISRRADLKRQATVLFYRALAAEQKRTIAEAAQVRYSDIASILEKRAAAGETSGYDALRLKMEQAAIEDRTAGAALELAEAKVEMQKLAGARVDALTGELIPSAAGVAKDGPLLVARLQALELEIKAARGRAVAASRRVVPEPLVSVGIQRQGGEGLPGFTGYYVGVQVPLPLFDHGQGVSASADARADKLEVERQRLLTTAAAALSEAKQRLDTNRARLLRQTENTKHGETLVDIARKGYGLGGVGLLTLLDAERIALDARLRAVDRAFDVRRAEADIAFLTSAADGERSTP